MDQLDLLAFHTHFPSSFSQEVRNLKQIANKGKSKFRDIFQDNKRRPGVGLGVKNAIFALKNAKIDGILPPEAKQAAPVK